MTAESKRAEARAEREFAARQRELSRTARAEARIKQKEEERMDVKAEKTQRSSEAIMIIQNVGLQAITAILTIVLNK